ncbi:hypothetical protein ACROYT_G040186 [Oculina patagonica]
MATHPEPRGSLSETDSLEILQSDHQDDLYSYKECKQIGKSFLNDLKQSIRVEYLPKIEEPSVKATKYLEETQVLQLLEDLIAKLVFKRPEKPIDFLVKEMEELKRKGTEKNKEDITPC